MKLRPDFTKQHKEMFYQIMKLRKDVLSQTDKKKGQFSMAIGVRLKVLAFINKLKKKRESKKMRRSTMGLLMAQQAYAKLEQNEMAVELE